MDHFKASKQPWNTSDSSCLALHLASWQRCSAWPINQRTCPSSSKCAETQHVTHEAGKFSVLSCFAWHPSAFDLCCFDSEPQVRYTI